MIRNCALLLIAVSGLLLGQLWSNVWGDRMYGDRTGYSILAGPNRTAFAVGTAGVDSGQPNSHAAIVRYGTNGARERVTLFRSPAYSAPSAAELGRSPSGIYVAVAACHLLGGSYDHVHRVVACNSAGDSLWTWDAPSSHDLTSLGPLGVAFSGNSVYVTGLTGSTGSGFDILTAKLTESGTLVWCDTFAGQYPSGDDFGWAILADQSGNAYVAGRTVNQNQRRKPVLMKYTSTGTLSWVKPLGSDIQSNGEFRDAAFSRDGCIYAVGADDDNDKMPIVKYSLSGDTIWTRFADGYAYALAVDSQNNVIVTGVRGRDWVTEKYNAAGSVLWTRLYNVPGGLASGEDVAVDPTGNVLVSGSADATSGPRQMTTIKYGPSGETLWVAQFDHSTSAVARSIDVDASGYAYVTGGAGLYRTATWISAAYAPNGPGLAESPEQATVRRASISVLPAVTRAACRITAPGWDGPLVVADRSGRVVRTLAPGSWDLCDGAGRRVADGVYFILTPPRSGLAPARIVVAR